MSKVLSLLTGFIVMFVLTIGSITSVQAAPQAAVMPSESINIAHFFKPPQGMDPSTAISHFNTIILTNGDHTYRSQLEARGFTSDIPQYFRSEAIQDPGSCSATPLNNQAAYKTGDFCYISQNHPDWFLLDSNGQRITVTSGGEYYRMDPSNAGWRQFFLDRVMESQNQYGWTSLFLDNVEGGVSKFYGPRSVRYPDNASYQNAVAGFLQYLYINYSQRYGRSIIGNIVARADDAVWFTYLQYLDGAMQERFAVDWDETDYLSASRWESDMTFMERTQSTGKYVILVAPGNRSDTNRQNFAFASYLLINQGKAAFRYSTDDSYREVWLYDNYKVDLGSPLGPRYRVGTTWRRDFSNGYVLVDPATHTARISNSVSSPPITTIFADVGMTHPYAEDIEVLYVNGLTAGCATAPLKFCPDQIMDRAQSAVFMLRGSFGTSYAPPEQLQHIFEDNWSRASWAEKWAEGMYNTGLSAGCTTSPLKFCPWDLTPREQAAVFGLKLKYGNSYEPPAATGSLFADMTDASYYATKWAEQAYRDGLIPSCGSSGGKPKFCPRELVTRGLGAYIIVRAKNLRMR